MFLYHQCSGVARSEHVAADGPGARLSAPYQCKDAGSPGGRLDYDEPFVPRPGRSDPAPNAAHLHTDHPR